MEITDVEIVKFQPRPPCVLIREQLFELPQDLAESLIQDLAQALSNHLDNAIERLLPRSPG